MEEAQRALLQRSRLRLVGELQVAPLWDLLLHKGVFTQDMIEEIQRAGTRRDQARQLVTDLQTRGRQAFPAFVSSLRETGQNDLAALLSEGAKFPQLRPLDLKPVEIGLRGGKGDTYRKAHEYLPTPVQAVTERRQVSTRPSAADQGSAAERSRRNSDMVYVLKADPCGYCLIINNVSFIEESDLSSREGSNVDCEKLEKRFKSLHFDVLVRRDLKAQEIAGELQRLARQDHSALDCCLVVILSHGCQTSHIQFPGGIYGTDGKHIPVEKIVNFFNGSHCPSLRGKPKLFFIQACGGEQKDRGFEVDSDSPVNQPRGGSVESDATPFQLQPGNLDEPDAVASLPTPSDILVSYSTFPGFVSWRDTQSGSWYVETLDSVLEQYAHTEDLLGMLVRVAHAVSAKGKYKQMPGTFNFLRKQFFFATD
ncbi:caspase-9 [Chrysemys picta bellii]|uniref:caspase-9 n=1 Tax=Chrysemys picta bellii TaxID=8478 RepID=UPI000388AD29|nr:LOW QUALITY PROTEIN: caspase-9 [Chrysemys picta bellii]